MPKGNDATSYTDFDLLAPAIEAWRRYACAASAIGSANTPPLNSVGSGYRRLVSIRLLRAAGSSLLQNNNVQVQLNSVKQIVILG